MNCRYSSLHYRKTRIKLSFKDTIEFYLWAIGKIPDKTRTPVIANVNDQFAIEVSPKETKGWSGDPSFTAQIRPSNHNSRFSKTVLTTRSKHKESAIKNEATLREKLYKWTTEVLKKRGKSRNTKTHTFVGAASENVVSQMVSTSSTGCCTKTDLKTTSERTMEASPESTVSYSKSSQGSVPKKTLSESIIIYIKSSDVGIQGKLTLKRVSSESRIIYTRSSDVGIQGELSPQRVSSESRITYIKSSDVGIQGKLTLKRVSTESRITYIKSSDVGIQEKLIPKRVSSESRLYRAKATAKRNHKGVVSKRVLSYSAWPDNAAIPVGFVTKTGIFESDITYSTAAKKKILEEIDSKRMSWKYTLYNIKPGDDRSQETTVSKNVAESRVKAADVFQESIIPKTGFLISDDVGNHKSYRPKMVSSESALCCVKHAAQSPPECILPKKALSDLSLFRTKSSVAMTQDLQKEHQTIGENLASKNRKRRKNKKGRSHRRKEFQRGSKGRRRKRRLRRQSAHNKNSIMDFFGCYPRCSFKY